ncbi:hypothetical protein LEP1GSC178_0073 [Leptospira licerasiae str. MMD4847]|uniref:Uncharacterized protein n=1 Tax=Leptospira licerasiae str. MMD4847 TaxID=1049971 RepID=A0ABP2RFV6_9LEPT|nr:hypothetical protein LEP1GSC178_0073 [Leptospira licerasiae str. MMD4847]
MIEIGIYLSGFHIRSHFSRFLFCKAGDFHLSQIDEFGLNILPPDSLPLVTALLL